MRLVDLRPTSGGAWRYVLGWGEVDVMMHRDGKITIPEEWEMIGCTP